MLEAFPRVTPLSCVHGDKGPGQMGREGGGKPGGNPGGQGLEARWRGVSNIGGVGREAEAGGTGGGKPGG